MIGRKKELNILNQVCEDSKSKLVVVHGRRRIGKTYLIDHMFTKHRADCNFFKFTGSSDQNTQIQMEYFIEAIYEWFGVEPDKPIVKWHQAFIFLNRTITNYIKNNEHTKKIVVFIDEIAWIDRHNKAGFISALGHFYNTYSEKYDNLIMILCGSNASWIKNKILKDHSGPLFHRVDKEIIMYPFDLKETKEYLLKEKQFSLDNKSVVDIYMILGGVAKYLSYLDHRLSFAQNINNLFFELNSPLYGEYDLLFKSLFEDKTASHKKVIDMLGLKKSGFTHQELEEIGDIKKTTLKNTIDELIDTGFIMPITKFNYKNRYIKYTLIDPFCYFHNKWVKSMTRNELATQVDFFERKSQEQDFIIWRGFAFENVCLNNINLYLDIRGLKAGVKSITYWHYTANKEDIDDKGAQIDILIAYQGNVYDIIECKYYNDEYIINQDYAQNLINKKERFIEHGIKGKKFDIKMVMLTTYGTKINQYYNQASISQNIMLDNLME